MKIATSNRCKHQEPSRPNQDIREQQVQHQEPTSQQRKDQRIKRQNMKDNRDLGRVLQEKGNRDRHRQRGEQQEKEKRKQKREQQEKKQKKSKRQREEQQEENQKKSMRQREEQQEEKQKKSKRQREDVSCNHEDYSVGCGGTSYETADDLPAYAKDPNGILFGLYCAEVVMHDDEVVTCHKEFVDHQVHDATKEFRATSRHPAHFCRCARLCNYALCDSCFSKNRDKAPLRGRRNGRT